MTKTHITDIEDRPATENEKSCATCTPVPEKTVALNKHTPDRETPNRALWFANVWHEALYVCETCADELQEHYPNDFCVTMGPDMLYPDEFTLNAVTP